MHSILLNMDLSATPPSSGSRAQDAVPRLLEQMEQWLSRRWVIAAINVALLLLLTYSIAQWTWRLLTPPVPASSTTAPVIAADNPEFDVSGLIAANLYGNAAPVGGNTQAEIPLSSLNLVLTGVFASPRGGVALISADGGPETAFEIGQEIIAGVKLHEVLSNRVLIKRGEVTESLLLKDTTPELAQGSILTGNNQAPARPAAAPASAGIQRVDQNRFNVSRQQMNQQMEKPDFLSQALMVPNAGGGFLVREIQPGSVYEQLGLRVGDVISGVNGQPVNTMQDVMKLYQEFTSSGASQVRIDVRRAGKSESLQYNIR
jgi:general secretion pathway protein C